MCTRGSLRGSLPLLSLLMALLAVSACDSQRADVEEPLPGFNDYLPLAVGKAMAFDYTQQCQACGPGFAPENLKGRLTWRVTGERKGAADARTYTVEETFQGVFTRFRHVEGPLVRDSVWTRWRSFRLSAEKMSLDGYTLGEVEWVEPEASSSSFLRFSADADTLWISHAAPGFRLPASMLLVRNRGLIRYSATDAHGFGSDLDMILNME